MGVIDAPQWLLPAYVRSVRALGATTTVEAIGHSGETLISMWSTPDRHFHNLKHAINMLARVDELADESHCPDVMRLAAWYHGCIFSSASEQTYRRNGGEDEVASAAYAARDLRHLGVPDATVDRICALILNLKRHNLAANDIDALALNDADLGALAVDPQQYKRYRELVRAEYAHIPVKDYLHARLAIITRLLNREVLFSSPLGERWERPARQNLQAEQRRLTDELARLERDGDTPAPPPTDGEPQRPEPRPAEPTTARTAALSGPEMADDADAPADSGAARTRSASGAPAPFPASASPRTSPASAASPRTPATGVAVERAPQSPRSRQRASEDTDLEHTASMESCAADLDRLLSTRRARTSAARSADRSALVEAERAKFAERLRERTETAKVLREARTGEIAPITAPIVDDGAGDL